MTDTLDRALACREYDTADDTADLKHMPWWRLPVGSQERELRQAAWEAQLARHRAQEDVWDAYVVDLFGSVA